MCAIHQVWLQRQQPHIVCEPWDSLVHFDSTFHDAPAHICPFNLKFSRLVIFLVKGSGNSLIGRPTSSSERTNWVWAGGSGGIVLHASSVRNHITNSCDQSTSPILVKGGGLAGEVPEWLWKGIRRQKGIALRLGLHECISLPPLPSIRMGLGDKGLKLRQLPSRMVRQFYTQETIAIMKGKFSLGNYVNNKRHWNWNQNQVKPRAKSVWSKMRPIEEIVMEPINLHCHIRLYAVSFTVTLILILFIVVRICICICICTCICINISVFVSAFVCM